MIHTYGVVDPAWLRRPELGAAGVERRKEQPVGVRWSLDLMEKERERRGSPEAKEQTCVSLWVSPPHLFIMEGRGGEATLEEGAVIR